VIGTMPRKAMESMKRKEQVPRRGPGSDETTCKAKLVFGMDSRSFYLVCGNGENVHTGHS
jgi:hypothetical protein